MQLGVPHETFSEYIKLLTKWNEKINLVSKSTIPELWDRHILDSAQLMNFIDKSQIVLDIGSGAGLPGIVLGILGIKKVILVESDRRKCSFLMEVKRILGLNVEILNERVENIDCKVDVITSRGFSSLSNILEIASKIGKYDKLLLLKGQNYSLELKEAVQNWEFRCINHPSITNFSSCILDITDVRKK